MSGQTLQQITFDPLGGALGLVVLMILAVALAGWAYGTSPAPLTRSRRIILWTCRGVAFVLLLLLLARPIAVVAERSGGRPEVVVLVDGSGSMALADSAQGRTRAQAAAEAGAQAASALEGRFDVAVRFFDERLHADTALPGTLVPDSARATAPGDVIESLLREPRAGQLAGVVVVSDGVSTKGRDLVTMARQLPVALQAVAIGDSVPPDDIQVVGVDVPPAAFVGEPVSIRVRVRSTGTRAAGATLVVTEEDGTPVARIPVALPGGGALDEVRFRVVPDAPGHVFYRLALEPEAGTANRITVNDTQHFALNVRKDRLQVLVLEGQLSWDFTFLRRTLERDTTLAYSYLVSPDGERVDALGDARVTSFPTTLDELSPFKAVVVGEVSPAILSRSGQELLAEYVEGGGGLLLLGGNLPPGLGRFSGTPLERVSPVVLVPPPSRGDGSLSGTPLSPRVTALGDAHPLVALHGDVYGNQEVWADLPPLRPAIGLGVGLGSVRAGGQVLVELEGTSGRAYPLVTVGRSGAGRVLVFGGRALWQWKFLREGLGTRDDFFERFWIGAMRWLADPEPSARIHVRPDRYVFRQGEDVVLSGRALGADLSPLTGATISATVASSRDSMALEADWGEGGSLTFRAGSMPAGRYTYRVVVEEPGAPPVRQEGVFRVDRSGAEWLEVAARPGFLRRAAEVSGGRVYSPDEIDALAQAIPDPPIMASLTREELLWNHPLPFILFLVVCGVEWWIRRRSGLA